MRKLFSSLLLVGSVVPLMWFTVGQTAAKQCPDGYFVTSDFMGKTVPATGSYTVSHSKFCALVEAYPFF